MMKAVQRAIDGGRHRVTFDAAGMPVILPLDVDPAHADDAALDAEIQGHISGNGHAGH